jgi:hypothetical protein
MASARNPTASRISSYNVAAADPNSLTVDPRPTSGAPDIICTAPIITGASGVVRPIADRHRDRARTITWSVRATSVVRATSIVRTTAVVIRIGAAACAHSDRKEHKQESRPLSSHFSFGVRRNCLRLPVINNVGFHTFIIRIRQGFHAPAANDRATTRSNEAPRQPPDRASHPRL